MKNRLAAFAALVIGWSGSVRAEIDPDYNALIGQDPGRPLVCHTLGYWQAAWKPGSDPEVGDSGEQGASAPIEWTFAFGDVPNFSFNGLTRAAPVDYGKLSAFHVSTGWLANLASTKVGQRRSILTQMSVLENEGCGVARADLDDTPMSVPASVFVELGRGKQVTPYPLCGERMVEIVDTIDGVRYQTCVDKAYPAATEISQITYVFDHAGLEWVWSPMPFRPDVVAPHSDTRDAGLWWPVGESCHPLFARRARESLPGPSKNARSI